MFQDLRDRHEKLKKRIHAFRIPLSPRGQLAMKCVYFSIPLIAGYFIMDVRPVPLPPWLWCCLTDE